MPIEVPASITELKDLIALKLDLSQEIVIDEYESPLTETFNVIVLSGQPEGTANQNIATAYGNKLDNLLANGGSYYFARVRRLDVDTKQKPDPFLAKTHRQFKRLVNLHPLGGCASFNDHSKTNPRRYLSSKIHEQTTQGSYVGQEGW